METQSPPMTPIRQYMSPLETSMSTTTSPTNSYREHLRRRTSSFSSNHDRSPASIRKNRFSNASQYSNDFSPDAGLGNGMGNLADELDQLDDEEEEGYDEDVTESTMNGVGDVEDQTNGEGSRDSGIDVSYSAKKGAHMRNFSKPFGIAEKPPDEGDEMQDQDKLSPELEDAMNNIARMTSYASTAEDPLIPRTIGLLQDLGNQSTLEAHAQRLTTSTNSITSNLITQSKSIQMLSSSLYSPFTFSAPIDPAIIEDTIPLITALLSDLPIPDPTALQGMQKLDRETAKVIQTLSQLTDTLQIGKQTTNTASRHLRTTQTIVADLRRERERAEEARESLGRSGWSEKVGARWCKNESKDIVGGFEKVCDDLRASLVRAGATEVV